MITGERQRDGHLAVVLLADLTAILPRDANRVRSLLGDAGVIDHPAADRSAPLHNRQHPQTNRGEQRLVGPVCLGHEVMQRLMRCLHASRFDARRHRLDALAGTRQQQAGAV